MLNASVMNALDRETDSQYHWSLKENGIMLEYSTIGFGIFKSPLNNFVLAKGQFFPLKSVNLISNTSPLSGDGIALSQR